MGGGGVKGVGYFLVFSFVYCLPFFVDNSVLDIREYRVRELLDGLLSQRFVQFELLRNLLGILGLLLIVYLLCCQVSSRLATKWKLNASVVKLATLLIAWLGLMSLNAWIFPMSSYSIAFQEVVGPFWVALCAVLLAVALACALIQFSKKSILLVSGSLLCGLGGLGWVVSPVTEQARGSVRNVILIGVDSLSADAFEKNQALMPNLSDLLAHGERFTRAYTPLGRTFPSWVSILSGKLPADHGAFFNLRNLENVERQDLLSWDLRALGYHTVFAIDERRFANIDETFGFDALVGPKMGALDFALQGVNDNPLSNLFMQKSLARNLFPYSYVNVAAHASYSASNFVEHVLEAGESDGPLFLAVHFESGHFPYKTRHAEVKVRHQNSFIARHLEALTVADRQIGQLLAGLKAQGRLDDALVVLLSDHGEAMGEIEARVMRDGNPFEVSGFGHGSDLLSDRQSRILLGVLRFVQGEPVGDSVSHRQQVSLLDLRAMVEAFARQGVVEPLRGSECLMVETGIRLDVTSDYRSLKEGDIATQAAPFYEGDVQGRLRLREDRLPELLADKDIGWRCSDRLTWYEARAQRYLAYSLDSHGGPIKQVEPDAEAIARIAAYRARYLHIEE